MAKIIFKSLFVLVILALLVLMGLENPQTVQFNFDPIFSSITAPSALMYFAFFAIGFMTGIILLAGMGGSSGGSGGGGSSSSKSSSKDKK